jgi:hypothetical protein
MAAMTEQEINRFADGLASDVCGSDPALVRGPGSKVATIIRDVLMANFAEEEAIHREAAQALRAMGNQTAGMDLTKLLGGIRQRIAQQHKFVL